MAIFLNDAFGYAAGVSLQTASADWTITTAGTAAVCTPAGRLRSGGTGTVGYQHSGTPASPDYNVSADFTYVGTLVMQPGIAGRITASTTYYFLRFESDAQQLVLYKIVGGAATVLGTAAATLTVGQTMRVTLEMVGTAIKGYRDGAVVISATDSSITAAGKAGFRLSSTGVPTDSLGVHLDNMIAEDGALAADTTAPILSSPTGTATGNTTATGTVTTDEANGTLYAVVTTSATPPSAADIRAGTGAAYATSQSVSAIGVQNFSAAGLTPSTAYYWHFLHDDAAANASNIATSASFTTDATPVSVLITEPLKNNTGTLIASQSGVKVAVLQASDMASVYETTTTTDASGLIPAITNVAIVDATSYHVAIKLADGSVGITGAITAS